MDERTYIDGVLHELEYWRTVNQDIKKLAESIGGAAQAYTEIHVEQVFSDLEGAFSGSFGEETKSKVSALLDESKVMSNLQVAIGAVRSIQQMIEGRMLALNNTIKAVREEEDDGA